MATTPLKTQPGQQKKWPYWVIAILGIAVVVLFAMWRFEIAPARTVWGDVATWVTGLATTGALIYAG